MRLKIWFRKNLKMSPGKIAAQAVHAALRIRHDDENMNVIVLGVSDKKFYEKLLSSGRELISINDAGYTEVEPGTKTCLAFYEE